MDIRTMPAGPELDRELILALGWRIVDLFEPLYKETAPFPFLMFDKEWDGYNLYEEYADGWPHSMFAPSSNWDAAGQVIEEMRKRGWDMCIETHPDEAHARFYKADGDYAEHNGRAGESLLSITIAAILALRSEAE